MWRLGWLRKCPYPSSLASDGSSAGPAASPALTLCFFYPFEPSGQVDTVIPMSCWCSQETVLVWLARTMAVGSSCL